MSGPGTGARDFTPEFRIYEKSLNWFFLSIALTMTVSLVILIGQERQEAANEQAFMTECAQHLRHYECVALWRAGHHD